MPLVTDTHALVWHMTEDSQLSKRAKRVFEKADVSDERVVIPCIVIFELLYLIEKGKVTVDFDSFVAMVSSSANYRIEPLCLPIIELTRRISRDIIKDPWDRLIAATAIHLKLPLITRDKTLRKVGISTVW
ncbi:MAG: type II toxin-antitoxin system VapC family toxin [Candidatus Zixiibacteriota bacterium]